MRYQEIAEIRLALLELMNERLPVAYEIAKNIKECEKITTEVQELVTTMQQMYADKDEQGKIVTEKAVDGILVKFSDPARRDAYQREILKINQENHEIVFKKIQSSALKDINLPARILLPLVDIIIEGE